jgi:hypothetical protein
MSLIPLMVYGQEMKGTPAGKRGIVMCKRFVAWPTIIFASDFIIGTFCPNDPPWALTSVLYDRRIILTSDINNCLIGLASADPNIRIYIDPNSR